MRAEDEPNPYCNQLDADSSIYSVETVALCPCLRELGTVSAYGEGPTLMLVEFPRSAVKACRPYTAERDAATATGSPTKTWRSGSWHGILLS